MILSLDLESLEGHVASLAAAALDGVVVRAFAPDTEPHLQRRLADLSEAGVRFALGSDGGPAVPTAVRLSALSARRAGVPLAALERAVTSDAAALLGLEAQVGSLTPGREGDVVLATGHPLDPRSRILAVVQDGRIQAAEGHR